MIKRKLSVHGRRESMPSSEHASEHIIRKESTRCHKTLCLAVLLALTGINRAEGFNAPHILYERGQRRCISTVKHGKGISRKPSFLMYVPSNKPTSTPGPMVADAIYNSWHTNRNPTKPKKNGRNNASAVPLSESVLSSSNTLPSFPTAHGLLSPETVLRMEEMSPVHSRDKTVDYFLRKYKKEGPMACLPMLSDPKILPHLTKAMRDVLL